MHRLPSRVLSVLERELIARVRRAAVDAAASVAPAPAPARAPAAACEATMLAWASPSEAARITAILDRLPTASAPLVAGQASVPAPAAAPGAPASAPLVAGEASVPAPADSCTRSVRMVPGSAAVRSHFL